MESLIGVQVTTKEASVDKMIKEKDFDSYAVLVSKDGQERVFMSDDF